MEGANRIFVNAVSQYVRTAICMFISLYSTRMILGILGKSDFGIYSLIGSIVVMLGFITTSLSASTQRFLSYSWGKNDTSNIKSIFANAVSMHLLLGTSLAFVLMIIERPLVHGYLQIASNRIEAADFVYYMVVLILYVTFLTAPVKALFIARENIVYVSVVEIIDAVIKLIGVFSLNWVTWDTLKAYAILMALISILTFFAYTVYALWKYEECHVPNLAEISWQSLRQMFGFTVWNIYSVGSTVIRSQGLAVVLNRFFGTLINSSYGIAMQVSTALSTISGSLVNAINPQLMKAEGGGNRQAMLKFTIVECKYSYLLMIALFIPVFVELPAILTFWLKDYPPDTVPFCAYIILIVIIDQSTIGLTSANQAIGNIRNYSLLIGTINLLILPGAWLALYCGYPASSVMVVYLLFVVVCGIVRILFLRYTAGLDVVSYYKEVHLLSLFPILGTLLVSFLMTRICNVPFRFVLTEMVGVMCAAVLIYFFSLSADEKSCVFGRLKQIIKRL